MHIEIDRDKLLGALAMSKLVSPRKGTLPMTSCVLIRAAGGKLGIVATDLYSAIQTEIEVTQREGGSVVVSTEGVYNRVNMMPKGILEIREDVEGGSIEISEPGIKRKYKMMYMDADDYPVIPEIDERAQRIKIGAAELLYMFSQVKHAMSTDITRERMHCAVFEIGEKGSREEDKSIARMVATDGVRFMLSEVSIDLVSKKKTMVVPYKACVVLAKILAGKEGDVTIVDGTSSFYVCIGDTSFSTRLIDVRPSKYDHIDNIDKGSSSCYVERDKLYDAIKAVSLSSDEYTGCITLTFEKGILTLKGESIEKGGAMDVIEVEYEGPAVVASYNARYLMDTLNALSDETIKLRVSDDALCPLVIRQERDGSFGVVMASRI